MTVVPTEEVILITVLGPGVFTKIKLNKILVFLFLYIITITYAVLLRLDIKRNAVTSVMYIKE